MRTATTTKTNARTRTDRTRRTPTRRVRDHAPRTGSRASGDDPPTPTQLRTLHAAIADAYRSFCDTSYARGPRPRRGRKESLAGAEVFEAAVRAWTKRHHRQVVTAINVALRAGRSGLEVHSVRTSDVASCDLVVHFRRTGERPLHALPVNVKLGLLGGGRGRVSKEQSLVAHGCTGVRHHTIDKSSAAWGAGQRGCSYLVLAFLGTGDVCATDVVFYDPILLHPDMWTWDLREPVLIADHEAAAERYGRQRLPGSFDRAAARFLATLLYRIEERHRQGLGQVDARWDYAGLQRAA